MIHFSYGSAKEICIVISLASVLSCICKQAADILNGFDRSLIGKAMTETCRRRMPSQRAGDGVSPVQAILSGNPPELQTERVIHQ